MFAKFAFLGVLLCSVAMPSWAQERGARNLPNLSVTFPDTPETKIPNRAQRIKALEDAGRLLEMRQLDELDQDRLYMSELRNGIRAEPEAIEQKQKPRNGKSILFLDLNFAPSEIQAAQVAAQLRGENLLVFPKRTPTQQAGIEKEYRLMVGYSDKLQKCHQAQTADCLEWQKKYVEAQERLTRLIEQIKKLDTQELDAIFSELDTQGVKLSMVIFSGHSGGTGSFSGLFGSMAVDDLVASSKRYPGPLAQVTSILLWGCYSGTLQSLTESWQKHLPKVRSFIGYRNRAPLGIRESSGRLLKSYVLKEQDLLAAPDMQATHKVFRMLDLVAELDGTAAIGELYLTYDRVGKIPDLLKACDEFDGKLLERYQCYNSGSAGCENPPANHLGPLRDLYSFLQVNRHCSDVLRQKYAGLPTPERLIRLIYIDTIKSNFARQHQARFQSFADYADEIGMPGEIRLSAFVHSTRAEDNMRLAKASTTLDALGLRDLSATDHANWRGTFVINESIRGLSSLLGLEYFWSFESCVPFSWVEAGATEKDTCGVTASLERPAPIAVEKKLLLNYYDTQFWRQVLDTDAALGYLTYSSEITSVARLRDFRHLMLAAYMGALQGYSDRSKIEDERLALYGRLLERNRTLTERDLLDLVLFEITKVLAFVENKIAEASQVANGDRAVASLKARRSEWTESQERLRKLLN